MPKLLWLPRGQQARGQDFADEPDLSFIALFQTPEARAEWLAGEGSLASQDPWLRWSDGTVQGPAALRAILEDGAA